jgi:hypothetical protein
VERDVMKAAFLFILVLIIGVNSSAIAAPASPTPEMDHQHDFDFEFGAWDTHIRRLLHPFTHSSEWVDYAGLSTVRKVWDGKANLGELKVEGDHGGIQGMSLRLYEPESHQWRISWANAKDGELGTPMLGKFTQGRGEFYNSETLNGAQIFVRFVFSDITQSTFRLEQAFSNDGGKSWEANWIASFTRKPKAS